MNQSEPILFRILHVFASFVTLQLLWFFFSLGIITVIPATLAMYAVVLEWSKNGIDLGIWKNFFHSFKYYFRKTLFLGLNIAVIMLILTLNATIIPALIGFMHFFMQVIWLFAASIFILTLIAMLPLIVTSHLKGVKLWKNAWIASITILPEILLIGIIGLLFAIVVLYMPMAIIAMVSLFAFIHITIWQRAVKKLPQDFLDQCLLKYRYR
ncbi:DUF624 domain-containing protein [Gracilibacillus massiliensis]|uniref:DUF624 domain-containing protein n=1 Tax=Gracilibacillus massiliensis TaxID=1564956 RepID=UPI000B140ED6|nr:DUF624 domain-containing protein [Gracilibacillus massiliensis]